jgi:hypothetical protein
MSAPILNTPSFSPPEEIYGDIHKNDVEEDGETKDHGKKRHLLDLLKKKDGKVGDEARETGHGNEDTKFAPITASTAIPTVTRSPPPTLRGAASPPHPRTPGSNDRNGPGSPRSPLSTSTSPSRGIRSSSPRLLSPASSLIFERNVQESHIPDDLSHVIPSHMQTEDHIPSVLEASSLAITDDHLNPDEVEIVTYSAHSRAAESVPTGTPHGDVQSPTSSAILSSPLAHEAAGMDLDEAASSYGAIDTTDPRRLSFISFADVVQAEHAENSTRDSMLHSPLSPLSPMSPLSPLLPVLPATRNRSPSPVRSPASASSVGLVSGGAADASSPSPPTSGQSSIKGMPIRTAAGAKLAGEEHSPPASQAPTASGDLVLETMSMAMKMGRD